MDTVIFRRWKDSGDIIALFPELPADIFGEFCEASHHHHEKRRQTARQCALV
jgi:hypothetical protein